MRQALAAGLIAALATAACARGHAEEPGPNTDRNYTVGSFDKIELAGAYEATVKVGPAPSVHASGGANVLDKLVVEVDGDTLKIHPEKNRGFHWGWKSGKVVLTITVPSLRAAELAGAGGLHIDKVSGDSFEGSVAGSGAFTVDQVQVGTFKLDIAGSGDAKAGGGTAKTASYGIAGSGDIDAKNVMTEDADVSIAGSGGVSVNATKTAKVSIAGSGDVDVTGGAKCTTSKMGSGTVRCG
jgi:hypothetical protein